MTDTEAEGRSAALDFAAGVVLFAISAVGTWSLSTNRFIIPGSYGNDPGPGLLPAILLGLLGLFSVTMMAMAGVKLVRLRGSGSDNGQSRRHDGG